MNVSTFALSAAALVGLSTIGLTTDAAASESTSWIFEPSTYTNDPETGARVAQYQRKPAVEPLGDPRLGTSRYRRIRTTLRGADGSVDSTYEVQNFGNGRGGLDAEWERFHDAWRQSLLTGSYFYQNQPVPLDSVYGYPSGQAFPSRQPFPGFRDPRFAPRRRNPAFRNPGHFPPGQGFPGQGHPGMGHPPYRHGGAE